MYDGGRRRDCESVRVALSPCSDHAAARAGVRGEGDGGSLATPVQEGPTSLPAASSRSTPSDMASSCTAWAKDPVAFRLYSTLRKSQNHYEEQPGFRGWTAYG